MSGLRLAVAALDQQTVLPREFLQDQAMFNPVMARDMQDIAEPVIGDHAGLGATMFTNGTGGDLGAMQDKVDGAMRNLVQGAKLCHAGHHAARRVVWRCRHLVDHRAAPLWIGQHRIGERTSEIEPEWGAAQDLLPGWMEQAWPATRLDAVGNLWGRIEGHESGKSITSGSHIDGQCPGGRYAGALGVVAARVQTCGAPKRPLEVLAGALHRLAC